MEGMGKLDKVVGVLGVHVAGIEWFDAARVRRKTEFASELDLARSSCRIWQEVEE